MAKKAITLHVGGIKCDGLGCYFEDNTAKLEEYELWINKPCPVCGENLLTQKDYDAILQMIKVNEFINSVITAADDEPTYIQEMKMDGSGKIKFSKRILKE